MKYLDLLSKFWEYNERLPFGSSAAVVYTFLVHKWYQNKYEDFILSDIELSKELKLAINTIKTVKEKLHAHKLIQFEVKIGHPCSYKLETDFSVPGIENILVPKKDAEKKKERNPDSTLKKKIAIPQLPVETEPTKFIPDIIPDIPSFDEFLTHAKSLKNYSTSIDSKIEEKYNNWIENGWKNGYDRPITNWKSSLKSTMPYIIDSKDNKEQINIPIINRPKTKQNE